MKIILFHLNITKKTKGKTNSCLVFYESVHKKRKIISPVLEKSVTQLLSYSAQRYRSVCKVTFTLWLNFAPNCLNQDFSKIFKIGRINLGNLFNLVKIMVQDFTCNTASPAELPPDDAAMPLFLGQNKPLRCLLRHLYTHRA